MKNIITTCFLCILFLSKIAYSQKNIKKLKNSKPNIIFIMTDDQGMGDFSCMGNQVVKTPNIDVFYQKSTRFTEYHVSPTCAPTRAALMSGNHEFRAGVTHTILERERMALDVYTLPQALQSAGYKTGLFGKWHLGDGDEYLPQNRGFNEVLMHGATLVKLPWPRFRLLRSRGGGDLARPFSFLSWPFGVGDGQVILSSLLG